MDEPLELTQPLKNAFAEASRLPEEEQVALAQWLMEELRSDGRLQAAFSGSANTLASLTAEALAVHREGRTKPLKPEAL